MKIVQIEDFFHPEAGYQINILSKYLSKFGHKVTIITSCMQFVPNSLTEFFGKNDIEIKDEEYSKKNNINIVRLPIKGFKCGRAVFTKRLLDILLKIDPDVIFCHGNDTFVSMKVLCWRNKLNKPLIFDNHMLKMASKNKLSSIFHLFYKLFYAPIIKKNHYYVIRTQNDSYVEKYLGIPLKQAPWISYGSDTLLFNKNKDIRKKFRKDNEISENDFVVVYAGKLDESKGGVFLANSFLKKFNISRKIVLICVGTSVGEYGKKVESIFSNSENTIIRFPTQKYIDLHTFFQASDLCVFAKQCSLSFYDAQACGIPVLSEANNINIERCSHHNGWNFLSGDIDDFRKKIEYIANLSIDEYNVVSNNATGFINQNYNYETKAKEYEKLIYETVEMFKK